MEINCKRCGRPFQTAAPGESLCPDCAAEDIDQHRIIRERVCIDCGVTFLGDPRAMRCPSCQEKRIRERDRDRKKTGPARKLGSVDRCERCGAEYVVNSGRQRYCKKCAAEVAAEAVRQRRLETSKKNKEESKFSDLWESALKAKDKSAFLAGLSGQDPDYASAVYDIAHMSVREMWKKSGMSLRALSEELCIPYRTLQDWCLSEPKSFPPDYVRLWIARLLGFAPSREE